MWRNADARRSRRRLSGNKGPHAIGIAVTPPLKTKAQSGCTIGLGMLLFVESWLGSKLYPQHLSAAPAHAAPARREMAHRCQ
jgi:hypothetical protein